MRVAVVGAGVAGLQQGRALQKRGIDFHIYEAEAGVGGVWRVTTHLQGAQGKRSSRCTKCTFRHLHQLSVPGIYSLLAGTLSPAQLSCAVAYPYYEFPEFPWPEALKQEYKGAVTAPGPAVQQYIQVLLVGAA